MAVYEGEAERPGEPGELRVGSSGRGRAANEVLIALSRAARSFLLYDPANEAIRQFLDALHDAVDGYRADHGDMPLSIRPFEIAMGHEVVFLDRDRERSLAFRLYRDGVRRLTIKRDVEWAEILKLLEVLSIRFIGVRQAEDDLVVLLWKAGFHHIEVEAVEGFVLEEDARDDIVDRETDDGLDEDVLDQPAPPLYARQRVAFRDLEPDVVDALVAEDGIAAIPDLCIQLVHELLTLVEDPADPTSLQECLPQLRELRDFVQTEGQLGVLIEMVRRLAGSSLPVKPGFPDPRADMQALLASFADERSLARLVHGSSRERQDVPPELLSLLQLVPGNHLAALVGVLEHETTDAGRRVARALIERHGREHADALVEEVQVSAPGLAAELLRVLRYASPEKGMEAVRRYLTRPPANRVPEVELAGLPVLEIVAVTPTMARLLSSFLTSSDPTVRATTLDVIARRRVQDCFGSVLERVKREGLRGLSPAEADAYGEALAGADPEQAITVFRDWIKPRGFFAALAPPMLRWVAVSGLVHLPGSEPEELIKIASDKGGADLARHCTECMVRRRRTARISASPPVTRRTLT